MPLLNRKRVPLTPVIPYDPKRKRKEVWYLRVTNEVFTSYEAYINKLSLYHQAIWECEATGRKNLTYEQALESEKTEYDRAEYKFCPALRKAILNQVKFQTCELDDLVDNIMFYLSNNFIIDEIVQCKLNDYEYLAKIIDITTDMPRQPNGRLRFPDAFLLPIQQQEIRQFTLQLLDEIGNPLEDCSRVVNEEQIYREKYLMNRLNIQKFIRECCYKDTVWLIKEPIAFSYGIDINLPNEESSFKKRKLTLDEKEAEKRARKEEKAKLKQQKERIKEERKRQAAIKYPLEDLDLPIYRKDPDGIWNLVDMAPQKCQDAIIPYPKAGKPDRPHPHSHTAIPPHLFDAFLSIWTFMTVFAEPLKIAAFSVDEFEQALLHTSHQPKATVLVEYNACLLNVIVKERKEDTMNEIINGDVMEDYIEALEEEEEEDLSSSDEDHPEPKKRKSPTPSALPRVERGWRDKECLKIGQKWDLKELRANYDRRGWESTLIGCLNDIATPDLLPTVDELLQHLVPKFSSSAADREKQYPTLSIQQKLDILNFLIDVVNESTLIKNYMDYCQEQLTEFRKQKVELNKELKALVAKRIQLDKRDRLAKTQEEGEEDSDEHTINSDSDDESDSSRYKKMERSRKKQYTDKEQHKKTSERKKLEDDEKVIKKKEEHLEKSMRRYMTLRIRPLGKDRFNNRYIYLDNIGVSNTYGSGRLYINSPSDGDIQLMIERDNRTDLPEVPWGYGGGRWFIKKLMQEQGFNEECEWLDNRMNQLESDQPPEYLGWWKYYTEPEEIDQLIEWLNPKGIRESKLKNELIKLQPYIIESMKKRAQSLLKSDETVTIRTRAKAAANS